MKAEVDPTPVPDVTVVIPCHNAAPKLGAQLAALGNQSYTGRVEFIAVNNCSTDGTADLLRGWAERMPSVRVVDAPAKPSAGYARNIGARAATGPLIAYCDADDEADSGWLAALVLAAESADVVGGSLEHALLNDAAAVTWRGADVVHDLPRPLDFLPFAVSANCAVRANVWRDIGGWDEDYRHCEDVDFSWRAQLAGFRLVFAPDAVMHYRHRDSLAGMARQIFGYAAAEARLFRTFRGKGVKRRRIGAVARSYVYPMTRLPYVLMTRRRRGMWLSVTMQTCGHLAGSWRYRVIFL